MRPIKFRAWDGKQIWGEDGVGISTLAVLLDGRVWQIKADAGEGSMTPLDENPPTLMQFTGLLDKNGKEIYEGDVMKSGNGRIWVIKHGAWRHWEAKQLTPMFGWYASSDDHGTEAQLPLRSDIDGFMEVIGNIHENPELLSK